MSWLDPRNLIRNFNLGLVFQLISTTPKWRNGHKNHPNPPSRILIPQSRWLFWRPQNTPKHPSEGPMILRAPPKNGPTCRHLERCRLLQGFSSFKRPKLPFEKQKLRKWSPLRKQPAENEKRNETWKKCGPCFFFLRPMFGQCFLKTYVFLMGIR